LQLLFPVLGLEQEASPRGLRDSDSIITINVFDEVVTPTAALKAMRAVARASNAGEGAGEVFSARPKGVVVRVSTSKFKNIRVRRPVAPTAAPKAMRAAAAASKSGEQPPVRAGVL
jgi:hypothetical protein